MTKEKLIQFMEIFWNRDVDFNTINKIYLQGHEIKCFFCLSRNKLNEFTNFDFTLYACEKCLAKARKLIK